MSLLKTDKFYKFSVFTFILIIIGLPIASFENYLLLIISIPIIIYSKINKNIKFKKILLFLLLFIIIKFLFPTLKIQEGNNLIVLNSNTYEYYKKNLPTEVFEYVKSKYSSYYNNSTCKSEKRSNCWENYDLKSIDTDIISKVSIYSKSSDWSFDKVKYSRILNDINFTNLKTARIEQVNNIAFNFFWPSRYDLVRENIPFFTMFEIPEILLGSSLCWKGQTFWENTNKKYYQKFNSEIKCSKIKSENINKKIYAVSFGGTVSIERLNELYGDKFVNVEENELEKFLESNELIINLEKNHYLLFIDIFILIFTILVIIFILFSFLNFDKKILFFSIIYSTLFVLVSFYVHEDLLNGFTIYTGGNDGLVYNSYANKMFYSLQNFDFLEFLRGSENVYYYMPGIRYFFALNKIFFGDSLYGYLLSAFFYPLIIYHLLELLIGKNFAIGITLISFLTRAFEGYALSTYKILEHIIEGDSEPLAIIIFLFCLFLLLKKLIKTNLSYQTSFYYFSFGFLLFFATAIRPNYLPGTLCLTIYMSCYLYIYEKNLKYSFYTLLGYAFLLLLPLHNYYFGRELSFFTKAGVTLYSYITIDTWFAFIFDILTFDLNDITNKYARIFSQLYIWIKPNEVHYIVTFCIVLLLFFLKNNFYLKFICLITLFQHLVCLYIVPYGRYAYLAWTLTIIINLYFLKNIYDYIRSRKSNDLAK